MHKKKNSTPQLYKTSTLSLAAYLSLILPLYEVDKSTPKKAYFGFIRNPLLDQSLNSYLQGESRVEPVSYFNKLKFIKSLIYGEE